ncbi:bifunctional copper resistance protein CopD/cytochrome c oxidase assembly protein [Microbacterium azadirachtae]|uniref:bifunctional copper resistance protein CopD/cytochrome c oxidase assembly protein n=1 Tax=Microbacterium azadirachtae TaxID=582680 RepID=UPI00088BC8FA|nr:bifunctional copper resistance protein CopD/cytochrome c oxidase assembly protein [Microbacterium azadirachtae]SDL72873.1 putative copper resistance protein D [Microbacterium azadirachtae]SEG02154.1 putative copper resistance protein D [Microbacterium azadirachtae]SEG04848.1 putative copper resistance protein D [Microbacterium azadirachtae]
MNRPSSGVRPQPGTGSDRTALPSGSSTLRIAGPVILVGAAVLAVVAGLAFGGGAAPNLLLDPGPVVRWGLPVVKTLSNLGAAAMLGSLVLALFALRSGARSFEIALDTASIGAAVFTVASAVAGLFTFLQTLGVKLSAGPEFGAQLGRFLLELPLGQAWLMTVLAGAVITIAAFAFRGWTATLLTAILAAVSFIPLATQGHAGDLSGHDAAVNSLLLHTIGAAVWIGGLLLLIVLRGSRSELSGAPKGGKSEADRGSASAERSPKTAKGAKGRASAPRRGVTFAAVVRRYSSLALVAYVVVAVSGVARSIVAVGDWAGMLTPYGGLIVAKAVVLILLGALGARYRTRLIPKLETSGSGPFWTLVLLELALMGIASGLAAALSRTPPPAGLEAPAVRTPAEILTGSALPPELTPIRWLTMWNLDLIWAVAAVLGVVLYLLGVRRLRARGDSWPIHRTVFWILGMAALVWVTGGAINAYQEYLFSVHMLGHMMLSMAIPLLLVSGSPVTLALRAIDKRGDGTRGGREWILWAVHSPFSRVVTNPFVAAAIFVLSLWAFYFTDLVRWAMTDHIGHEWMTMHFLISGYLFVLSLIGADPVPRRLPYAGRLITLIAVMATHAFFGMAIMMQSGLMVAEWFGAMGRTWGATPLQDQYVGGGVAWSVGEIPTLILAITVAIQWSRSDAKVQKRADRAADRSGDAELEEYNARLAELAEKDRRAAARGH